MNFIRKLSMLAATIVSCSVTYSNAATLVTPLYACDTCGYDQALYVAKQHAPDPECTWQGSPDEQPEFGDGIVCVAKSQNIIVSNTLTKQSYKFKVTHAADIRSSTVTATNQTITSTEQYLINQLYQLDTDFRNAIQNLESTNILASNYNNSFIMPLAATNGCDNHPTEYFRDEINGERNLSSEFASKIANAMGNSSWSDFTDVTKFTGGNLQISKDGIGIGVSLQHNANKYYVTKIYGGSPYNKLVFEVSYQGDANFTGSTPTRNLNLELNLQKGSSQIDGIPLSTLFGNGTVDLSGVIISECLRDFIMDEGTANSDGSGGTGSEGSGSSGTGGMCLYSLYLTTCATSGGLRTCSTTKALIPCS